MRSKRMAFTLIELLVVVSIIALLIGILLPSLNRVKTQARRTACGARLRQVGIAMVSYMQDSRDRMPHVSFMPSIGPGPLTTDQPIYLADVLSRHVKGQMKVFECTDDRPGRTERSAPNAGKSYYQSERSSYEYRVQLAGLTPVQFDSMPHGPPGHEHRHDSEHHAPNTIWFARDFNNFHGKAGQNGARRYVYIDAHIGDFEN